MKIKLIITVFIWIIFIGSYLNKKINKTEPQKFIEKETKNLKLSDEEQLKIQDYLLSARTEKYECERDFRKSKTGNIIEDKTDYGKGKKVIYCRAGKDTPGYLVKGVIRRNGNFDINNKWLNDTLQNFIIKPRMRIRQDLVYPLIEGINEQNTQTPVCRLEIVNTEGKIIEKVEYKAHDFWEKHPENECKFYYSGNYRSRKGFIDMFDSVIMVSGKRLNPTGKINTENTPLDFSIYWYGYTDLWLDYIEVSNEVSVRLLDGYYDMWIRSIESIEPGKLEKIKAGYMVNPCYNYLANKFQK